MNCSECQEVLLIHLDGGVVADRDELDRHLHGCADCRGCQAAVGRLDDGLRLCLLPAPPSDFAAAVTRRVCADLRARQLRRRWVRVAALAAVVLVALGLVFENERIGKPGHDTFLAKPQATPAVVATAPRQETPAEPPPSPLELVSQSRQAVAALPRRVVEETVLPKWSLSMDVLPELPRTTAEEPEAIAEAAQSLTEAGQGMAVAWEAVEGPMRRATTAWSRLTPSLPKQ